MPLRIRILEKQMEGNTPPGIGEIVASIALARINYFNIYGMMQLYRRAGGAEALLDAGGDIRDLFPEASPKLVEAFRDTSGAVSYAKAEYEWCTAHGVEAIPMADQRYPQRLKECEDAPPVLFYKGSAGLNPLRAVCVVGTRRCTQYGQDILRRFTADLAVACPGVVVVSGLAYGIDICAHRNALQNGMETVGVLAHGLDSLYPPSHRATAVEMVGKGGLLTEYPSGTKADKMNFVRRNRIVAGMADACIVVESAAKGGGLITAKIARDYNREVFAFPGPVDSQASQGCNNLVRDNVASLVTSAADFVKAMGWEDEAEAHKARKAGVERPLFPDLTADEEKVVAALSKRNDLQVNMLATQADMPISRLSAIVFSLEMKGVVKMMAGGACHLYR